MGTDFGNLDDLRARGAVAGVIGECNRLLQTALAPSEKAQVLRIKGLYLLKWSERNLPEAESCFKEALPLTRSEKERAMILANLAMAAGVRGDYESAQQIVDRLSAMPAHVWKTEKGADALQNGLYALAYAYHRVGRYEEAIAAYRQAIGLGTGAVTAHAANGLADACLESGRLAEGEAALQQARAIGCDEITGFVRCTESLWLLLSGNLPGAEAAAMEASVASDQRVRSEAYLMLGRIEQRRGDLVMAEVYGQMALNEAQGALYARVTDLAARFLQELTGEGGVHV